MLLNKKTNNDAKKGYTPSGFYSWSFKLGSEFFGTIFLTWMIGLLGVTFGGTKFEYLISYGNVAESRLAIGFWVALDVFLCLAIFSRWSCDLNPAVTTYRIISGQNSVKYGLIKIGVQLLGGLAAGLAIWSTQEISHLVSGNVSDSATSYANTWSAFTNTDKPLADYVVSGGSAGRHLLAFGGEIVGGLILLTPIFAKTITNGTVKDIFVVAVVGFGVAALLELGTVGWNPARSLGTNFIFDVVKGGSKAMQLYWAYAFGPIVGAVLLFFSQKFAIEYATPAWEKWISLGKVKDIEKRNKK